MPGSSQAAVPLKNRLLSALPHEEYVQLGLHLEPLSVESGYVIYAPQQRIEYVYFPCTSIVSLLAVMEDGATVEAATIGNEGTTGVPIFLGADTALEKALIQVPGAAIRIQADRFREAVTRSPVLHRLLQRYTHILYSQLIRSSACNRLHSAVERCSRWLLMIQEQVDADQFVLTHEFLSRMLGVRRETVTTAAAMLQQQGLIHYRRGRVTILNREGLEAASCNCYQVGVGMYKRLLP